MINKIKNIKDLRVERERLQQKRFGLEGILRNDFALIKEDFKPRNIIKNSLGGILNFDDFAGDNLLGSSLTMGIDLLISKVLMRKSGIAKKLIVSWLIRKYGVDFVNKNSDDILSLVKKIIGKLRGHKKNSEPSDIYDGGTVAQDF